MNISFYSKRILKILSISFIIPLTLFEINTINKQIKAEKNLIAASEKDLFLYRQMGASYLCIASKAEVDFNKGLGIASATFANVIIGKHGGAIKELGNKKLDEKKLYNAGTFQIVGSALNICPESIPKNIKNDYEKKLYKKIQEIRKYFTSLGSGENCEKTLEVLAEAKIEVSNFFEDVIVNDDDEALKKNRLELLQLLCKTFNNYINFSNIEST